MPPKDRPYKHTAWYAFGRTFRLRAITSNRCNGSTTTGREAFSDDRDTSRLATWSEKWKRIPRNTFDSLSTSRTYVNRGPIAKDCCLLALEILAQSSDVFPPLKSVACGLLFMYRQTGLVIDNKYQITTLHDQISRMAASLVQAVPDVSELSNAHREAINALHKDLNSVYADLRSVLSQRPILRYLRAKRHSADIQAMATKLQLTSDSFTRALIASTEINCSQILLHAATMQDDTAQLLILLPECTSLLRNATLAVLTLLLVFVINTVSAILHSFNCKRLPSALEVAQVDPINYLHLAPSNKSHSKEPLRRIDSAD